MILSLFLVTLSYLMGSFCSAVVVCRLFDLPDPREEGSKNPGATNVLRLAGKKYAAIVMLADLLKGTIPVVIAQVLGASPITLSYTVLAAVVGHMFPIFFGFKGGKGVATAIGALLGFDFIVGVAVSATWLVVAKLSRYSSLASTISITLAPFYAMILLGRVDVTPPLFFLLVLVLYKHRNNVTRLADGLEPKIKFKKTVLDEFTQETKALAFEDKTASIKSPEPEIAAKKPIQKKRKPASTTKKAKPTKEAK